MSLVGVRDLKNQLSRYLEEVEGGEMIGVTRRGRVIAYLIPAVESQQTGRLAEMVQEGLASWGGGSPKGAARPARAKGLPMSDLILEERN